MAKLIYSINEYKLYKKKRVKCGCCHRDFVSEPFVMYIQFYSGKIGKESNRCWRCVRSREAVDLIYNKWPGLYKITKKGQYYYLDYTDRVADVFTEMLE